MLTTRRNTHSHVPDTTTLQLGLDECANRLGPAPAVLRAWEQLLHRPVELRRPPTSTIQAYVEAYGRYLGDMNPSRLLAGRGVSEFLTILGDVLPDTAVIAPEYSGTLAAFRSARIYAPDSGDRDTADARLRRVEHAMASHMYVVLSNPSNPLGHYIPRKNLLELCQAHPQSVLVVDEEYIRFQRGGESLAHPTTQVANCVVLQSSGKTYGIPGGARAGVMWTPRMELRSLVAKRLPLMRLSAFDVVGAVAAMADTTWLPDALVRIHQDAILLQAMLTHRFGERVVPNSGHWRFVHLDRPERAAKHFKKCGIAVRAFTAEEQAGTSGIRVATPHGQHELELLHDALATLPASAR